MGACPKCGSDKVHVDISRDEHVMLISCGDCGTQKKYIIFEVR